MDQASSAVGDVFRIVDLVGVLCNGIIGGRIARKKRFDYVGFAILALMSALGGGAIRDILLNTVPVALTDPYYLATALLGALIAFLWRMDSKWSSRMINIADGIVLGTWSATGVVKTLSLGFNILPAILMGITTAVGGGMIRDVSAGNVPKVLQRENLYVTPAAISAIIMVGCYYAHYPMVGMAIASIVAVTLSMLAQKRKWTLPEAPEMTITMTPAQFRQILRLRGIKIRKDGKIDYTQSQALNSDDLESYRKFLYGNSRLPEKDDEPEDNEVK
ncbi:MAG: trimeric intracellular cation channel family protein [Actinomycetaceae bacterium]|nr:trimeric intracellular cation channel family protein [Actinomycetaceae bacterium]